MYQQYQKNLRLVFVETILTSIGAGFCVATMTVFWNAIGMNQTDIGFVQMAFTIVLCLLDIPLGYVADRFNRKVLNIVGDFGVAIVFIFYAFSKNMYMALISECLLGAFMATTNGVDQSFIKYNCDKIDETGNLFKKTNVRVHTLRYVSLLAVTAIGGLIAKINLRLCVGASALPYFLGGLIALKVQDFSEKAEVKYRNPLKDMVHSVKEIVANKKTRLYLMTYVLGKEITHAQIWVFTPLLMMVGIPVEIVSMGWILNYLMQTLGGKVSEKMISQKVSQKFAIPVVLEFTWMMILLINTNIVTVWLFAFNGFVHGMLEGNLVTAVQESAKAEIQTSVVSIAYTGARILYVPLVYFVNYLGNMKLQWALLGVCVVFLPMCLSCFIALKRLEKKESL